MMMAASPVRAPPIAAPVPAAAAVAAVPRPAAPEGGILRDYITMWSTTPASL